MPPTAPTSATHPHPRCASQTIVEPHVPADAKDGVQAVVLVSIDLRSQHGRLVSARISASVRERTFWVHAIFLSACFRFCPGTAYIVNLNVIQERYLAHRVACCMLRVFIISRMLRVFSVYISLL